MKIYTNEKNEIVAINSTDDPTLKEIKINRDFLFEDKTDFMVLNYCCIQKNEGEFIIYPKSDYIELCKQEYSYKLEEAYKVSKSLEKEVAQMQYALMMGGLI